MKWNDVRSLIQSRAEEKNEFPAFSFFDEAKRKEVSISYGKLWEEILALGTYLYHRNIVGKHIVFLGRTSYKWLLAFLTVLSGNNTAVPIDPEKDEKTLGELIEHSDAEAVFCNMAHRDLAAEIIGDSSRVFVFEELEQLMESGRELIGSGERLFIDEMVDPKKVGMIIYTSGTTSIGKAVMLRQESMLTSCIVLADTVYYGENPIILNLPVHHIFAIECVILGSVYIGNGCYIGRGFRYFLKEIKMIQPNVMFLVPTQARLLGEALYNKTREQIHNLVGNPPGYLFVGGASPTGRDEEILLSSGIRALDGYGLSENCGTVSKPVVYKDHYEMEPGSKGRIVNEITVKIDNPDQNGIGEIIISGPTVFEGYYKAPEETAKVLIDGWLHTGDLGRIDDKNNLYLTGRLKNIIVLSNGENVSPEELEHTINLFPNVEDSVVFGRDDKLCVMIYPKRDSGFKNAEDANVFFENKIRELNKKNPGYKMISRVLISSEPLEKTVTGKIKRKY